MKEALNTPSEGYVRFKMILEPGPAPQHPHWEQLNEVRNRLYAAGLIGMNAEGIGFGNLSVRVGETSRFVISGTATGGQPLLTPADYCEVTSFDIAGNTVTCRGPIKASAESMTHGAVYAAHAGIRCVIHVHSASLWRHMLERDFAASPQDAEYGTPAIAEAVRKVVADLGGERGTVVMAGHEDGVLAYGPDITTAEQALQEIREEINQ